jgi:hypothetical protein
MNERVRTVERASHGIRIPDVTGSDFNPEMSQSLGRLSGVPDNGANLPAALRECAACLGADKSRGAGYDDGLFPIDLLRLGLLGYSDKLIIVKRMREELAG